MEKRELGVLCAVVLGIVVIGFLGNFTGYVINQTSGECNIIDFNADGFVDGKDRVEFSRQYELNLNKKGLCVRVDLTEDGVVDIRDSSKFSTLYSLNFESETGPCVLKRLACEEPEMAELPSEKPSIWQKIKNFFT